ncbi:MAG: hypothetical protein DRH50_04850 [Deltaproteobacteria bacterium]|nr:MAG: hypothetical protein DRH50_04850 [Deltaproteobacteria bacterium]
MAQLSVDQANMLTRLWVHQKGPGGPGVFVRICALCLPAGFRTQTGLASPYFPNLLPIGTSLKIVHQRQLTISKKLPPKVLEQVKHGLLPSRTSLFPVSVILSYSQAGNKDFP